PFLIVLQLKNLVIRRINNRLLQPDQQLTPFHIKPLPHLRSQRKRPTQQHILNRNRMVHYSHEHLFQMHESYHYILILQLLSYLLSLSVNSSHYYFRVWLTMTLFTAVVFLRLIFENSNLLLTTLFFNFCLNCSSFYIWSTYFNIISTNE